MFFHSDDSVWLKDDRKKYRVWVADEKFACLHNPFYTTYDDHIFAVRMFVNDFDSDKSYKNVIRIIDKDGLVIFNRKKKVVYSRP